MYVEDIMFLKQVNPKIPTSGSLVFEVPNKTDKYTLLLSGGFWAGSTAKVALN